MANINFRDSQSYALGSGVSAAGAGAILNMTAARSLSLGQLIITPGNELTLGAAANGYAGVGVPGNVTALTIQGQSLMTSNQPVPIRAFSQYATDQSHAYIGMGLVANGVFQVVTAGVAGGPVQSAAIFCDPWDDATQGPPPAPDQDPSGLNYVAGLGNAVGVAAGANAVLQCTILRPCVLGFGYLHAVNAATNLFDQESLCTVTSIQINATEMLSSQLGAAGGVPLNCFSLSSQDSDQRVLGAYAPMNSTVTVTINNGSAVALDFAGAFFCQHA